MRTEVQIYVTAADLLAFVRERSTPGDDVPDTATIEAYTDGDYVAVDPEPTMSIRAYAPIRISYESK